MHKNIFGSGPKYLSVENEIIVRWKFSQWDLRSRYPLTLFSLDWLCLGLYFLLYSEKAYLIIPDLTPFIFCKKLRKNKQVTLFHVTLFQGDLIPKLTLFQTDSIPNWLYSKSDFIPSHFIQATLSKSLYPSHFIQVTLSEAILFQVLI